MGNKKKLDALGISAFAESMAMMFQSGVSADAALRLMKQDQADGILAEGLKQMAEDTEEGKSLEQAMRNSDLFPEYALEMVKAGERTGALEEVMRQLADYYADQKVIVSQLRSAVVYPSAMIALIIVVLIIMLKLVLPAFADVYQSLSAASLGYLRFSYTLCRILLAIMVLLLLCAAVGLLMWNGKGRDKVEKVLRKVPLFASILDDMGTFRFTSAFEVYLASGEMQDLALLRSMKLTDCKPVEEKLKRCAEHMEEGHGFAYAANRENLYEPIYGKMLVPAERSGNMLGILKRLVELLKEDISQSTVRFVNTVEPLLSGILMISIGLILISLMLPLIGMMNSIG